MKGRFRDEFTDPVEHYRLVRERKDAESSEDWRRVGEKMARVLDELIQDEESSEDDGHAEAPARERRGLDHEFVLSHGTLFEFMLAPNTRDLPMLAAGA